MAQKYLSDDGTFHTLPFTAAQYFDQNGYAQTNGWKQTLGLTPRVPTIDPTKKTLVLIVAGQSLGASVVPTLYIPTHTAVIHQLDIYGGNFWPIVGPVLGTTFQATPPLGPGNAYAILCDQLIAGVWDEIIFADISVGGTLILQWGGTIEQGGIYSDRVSAIMQRLAAQGITPARTGVTFALILQDGIADFNAGTSGPTFVTYASAFLSASNAAGFSGRSFVALQSGSGQTSNVIRTAQASLWNGTTVFSGGDNDSSTIATSDGVHPNDAGAITLATIVYNAMRASGPPF